MTLPLHSFQYDAIVVGMGPAVATTAYELSQLGMSVMAFDKQVYPRYKICGGRLSLGVSEFVRGRNRPKRSLEDFIRHESALAGLSIPSPLGDPIPIAHDQANRSGHRWTGSEVILSQADPQVGFCLWRQIG